jgi:hypothetical protein
LPTHLFCSSRPLGRWLRIICGFAIVTILSLLAPITFGANPAEELPKAGATGGTLGARAQEEAQESQPAHKGPKPAHKIGKGLSGSTFARSAREVMAQKKKKGKKEVEEERLGLNAELASGLKYEKGNKHLAAQAALEVWDDKIKDYRVVRYGWLSSEFKWDPNDPEYVRKMGEVHTRFEPITYSTAKSAEDFENAFVVTLFPMTYRRELPFAIGDQIRISPIAIQKGYEKFLLGNEKSKRSLSAYISASSAAPGLGFEHDTAVEDEGKTAHDFLRGEIASIDVEAGIVAKITKRLSFEVGVESHNKIAVGNTGGGVRTFEENDIELYAGPSYAINDDVRTSLLSGTEWHNRLNAGKNTDYTERVPWRVEWEVSFTGVPKLFKHKDKSK